MYISSVGNIMEEAATRLNEVSADESDVYSNWVNLCTRDIQLSFPQAPFLYASADRTLSASTRQYTNLPSDFEKMITIVYPAGDVKMKYLTEEEFTALQPSASETGTPSVFTIHGAEAAANQQVEFYPVPGSALTVNYQYRRLLTDVSAQSAAPPIPIKWRELYVLYLEKMGLRRREDYTQAELVEAKYEQMKQQMIDDFKRRTEEPWRIKSIREFTQSNRQYGDEIVDLFWGNDN